MDETDRIKRLSKLYGGRPDICYRDANRKKFAYEYYALIAGILPFIGDEKQRSYTINKIAEEKGISKQTIRHYLCLYLTYQSIAALASKQKAKKKPYYKTKKT